MCARRGVGGGHRYCSSSVTTVRRYSRSRRENGMGQEAVQNAVLLRCTHGRPSLAASLPCYNARAEGGRECLRKNESRVQFTKHEHGAAQLRRAVKMFKRVGDKRLSASAACYVARERYAYVALRHIRRTLSSRHYTSIFHVHVPCFIRSRLMLRQTRMRRCCAARKVVGGQGGEEARRQRIGGMVTAT